MGTEDNYIIDPGDIDYDRLRDLLQSIGQKSAIVDLSGETLAIEQEGNCSWFIRIRENTQIVFTGIGHFLPEYSEKERWRLLNGANSEAKLSRFSFLGERALSISYTLVCASGLPSRLFLDSWLALQQEQRIFLSWLRDITPAERTADLPDRQADPVTVGPAGSRSDRTLDLRDFMLGSLFGSAIGDAMGAPAVGLDFAEMEQRFGAGGISRFEEAHGGYGKVTGNTQMALFTLEALLRSRMRIYDQGTVKPAEIYFNAYLRWAKTQGISIKDYRQTSSEEAPGWLVFYQELQGKRSPDQECLRALADANRQGSLTYPINNSRGCGGIVRAAPAGFFDTHPGPFEQGCRLAAVTNGHPTAFLSSGFLAELIACLRLGYTLAEARDAALRRLSLFRNSAEVAEAVERAAKAAAAGGSARESIETLGSGWSGEEVLAISLYCAEKCTDFRDGILMAVNHSGNSCATGTVTGSILGALHGFGGLYEPWRDQVELRELILELVEDAIDIYGRSPGLDRFWKKYPPC